MHGSCSGHVSLAHLSTTRHFCRPPSQQHEDLFVRHVCPPLSKAMAFCFAIDQDIDHHKMMRIDTNKDYSFDGYEAPVPRSSHMEERLDKFFKKIIEAQEKTTKLLVQRGGA